MKLGTLVADLIRRSGVEQKVVAITWKERWDARHPDDTPAFETVESRLSSLRNGRADGVKFFFTHPERRDVLFEVLEPTDAERQQLIALGEEELERKGAAPLRLVVDLAGLEGDPDVIIGAAADVFLAHPEVGALAVVVTEPQYRRLTIAWTERGTRIERVKEPGDGEKVARDLAGDAIVASRWRHAPYERWLALDVSRKKLVIDPEDGLDRLARDGRLDTLPEVVADLGALGVEPLDPGRTYGGAELRRVIRGLALGEVPDLPAPANRLGLARRLGVAAGASEDERIGVALRAAGLPAPEPVDAAALATRLERASRRPVPPAVLRAEREWHVINGEVPAAWQGHARVREHRFAIRPTGLARLKEALAGWTVDDYAADPRLEGLIARLDPEGDGRELRFARAWLVERDELPVTAPAPASLDAVRALLAEAPPAAEMVVVGVGAVRRKTRESMSALFVGEPRYHGEADVLDQCAGHWWRQWWSRGRAANRVQVERKTFGWNNFDAAFRQFRADGGQVWELPVHLALGAASQNADEAFLDAWEALPKGSAAGLLWNRTRERDPDFYVGLKETPLPEPDWRAHDAALALLWTALRAACHTAALSLPGGDLLVRLGGGVAARLEARTWDAAGPARAGLHQRVEPDRQGTLEADRLYEVVPAWTAAGHGAGPRLPVGLTLAGRGVAIDVQFLPDPLGASLPSVLAPTSGGMPLGAVAALAAEIEIEEQRRRDD